MGNVEMTNSTVAFFLIRSNLRVICERKNKLLHNYYMETDLFSIRYVT